MKFAIMKFACTFLPREMIFWENERENERTGNRWWLLINGFILEKRKGRRISSAIILPQKCTCGEVANNKKWKYEIVKNTEKFASWKSEWRERNWRNFEFFFNSYKLTIIKYWVKIRSFHNYFKQFKKLRNKREMCRKLYAIGRRCGRTGGNLLICWNLIAGRIIIELRKD